MCRGHHHRGRHGRHGVPNREQMLEHLQHTEQRLQQDLANVRELIERLGPAAAAEQPVG